MAILAKTGCCSNHRQAQKQKSGDFKPQNASDAAGMAHGDIAGAVERADPAILAGAAAGYAQQGPATSTKVTSCRRIFLALHGVLRYPYSSSGRECACKKVSGVKGKTSLVLEASKQMTAARGCVANPAEASSGATWTLN